MVSITQQATSVNPNGRPACVQEELDQLQQIANHLDVQADVAIDDGNRSLACALIIAFERVTQRRDRLAERWPL